jgi:hypothetical protein
VPNPSRGENLSQFVSRFMGSKEAQSSFPDPKQRAAVAYSKMRRKKKRKA